MIIYSPMFKRDDDQHLVIVQCDSGHTTGDLIAYARYHIYNLKANADKGQAADDEGQFADQGQVTHVLFIIHLHNHKVNSSFIGFQGDPWVSSHIDDLRAASDLSVSAREAIGLSISELFWGEPKEVLDQYDVTLQSQDSDSDHSAQSDNSIEHDAELEEQDSPDAEVELWVERVHADEVPKRATVEMSVDDIEDVDFDLQGEEADYDSSSHEAVTDLKPDDSEIEVSVDVVTPFTSVEEAPQASVETSAFELSTSEVPTMEEPAAEAPIAVEVPMPEDLSVKAHIVSGHPEEPEACLQESTFESPPVDTPMLIESSSELQESLVEVAVVEQSVTDIPALLEDPTEVPKSPVEAIVEARLELESPAEVLLSEESPIVSPMLEEAPFEPSAPCSTDEFPSPALPQEHSDVRFSQGDDEPTSGVLPQAQAMEPEICDTKVVSEVPPDPVLQKTLFPAEVESSTMVADTPSFLDKSSPIAVSSPNISLSDQQPTSELVDDFSEDPFVPYDFHDDSVTAVRSPMYRRLHSCIQAATSKIVDAVEKQAEKRLRVTARIEVLDQLIPKHSCGELGKIYYITTVGKPSKLIRLIMIEIYNNA